MTGGGEERGELYPNFPERIFNQISCETMKHTPISMVPPSISTSSSSIYPEKHSPIPDLLWISKHQQKHPSTHAHPLKNTIRVKSNGIRYKFDGKQWRPLCRSPDSYECRNLAFRSTLCQKHFYNIHLFKHPYTKNGCLPQPSSVIPPVPLKRPLSNSVDYQHHPSNERNDLDNEDKDTFEEDDSIQVLENHNPMLIKRDQMTSKTDSPLEFNYFPMGCDPQSDINNHEVNYRTSAPLPKMKRLDSCNNDSGISNESESPSINVSMPKVVETIRLGLPPLTRTEEKSLANELITQLPADASLTMAEHLARQRACDIVLDNYSHYLSSTSITYEWFYDFLLRNPRVPIHFQSWFTSVKATMPSSEQLIDIKIWELGLVTRSITSSSSHSSSSFSP